MTTLLPQLFYARRRLLAVLACGQCFCGLWSSETRASQTIQDLLPSPQVASDTPPIFADPVFYQVGYFVRSVTTGDVNGDHHVDVIASVTSVNAPSRVVVFLGNGDGTLQPHIATPLDNYRNGGHLAIGDLNSDGLPDLALGSYNNDGVHPWSNCEVQFGHGDGTFQQGPTFQIGTDCYDDLRVVLVDANRDGRLDIAAACGASVVVLPSRGDGTFGSPLSFYTGERARNLAVGDFNGDAKPDLAVVGDVGYPYSTGSLAVLIGRSTGGFFDPRLYNTGFTAYPIAVVDLDHDDYADVVTTANVTHTVWVHRSNHGTLMEPITFETGFFPRGLAVEDFNGDNIRDIAVATIYPGLTLHLAHGDGTFGPALQYSWTYLPGPLVAADLNEDGRPDLVSGGELGSAVAVQLNMTGLNLPPDCSNAHPRQETLWPPDHRLVPLEIDGITDADGDPISITILDAQQNEVPTGACPSATLVDGQLALRRDRNPDGDGRIYRVSFLARDGRGGEGKGEVWVCVPHDRGNDQACRHVPLGWSAYYCPSPTHKPASPDQLMTAPSATGPRLSLENRGSSLAIYYALPGQVLGRVTLFDVGGRRIASYSTDATGAGTIVHDASGLSNGVYFVELRSTEVRLVRTWLRLPH